MGSLAGRESGRLDSTRRYRARMTGRTWAPPDRATRPKRLSCPRRAARPNSSIATSSIQRKLPCTWPMGCEQLARAEPASALPVLRAARSTGPGSLQRNRRQPLASGAELRCSSGARLGSIPIPRTSMPSIGAWRKDPRTRTSSRPGRLPGPRRCRRVAAEANAPAGAAVARDAGRARAQRRAHGRRTAATRFEGAPKLFAVVHWSDRD